MPRFLKLRTASRGKDPGSLILIGNQKQEQIRIRVMSYDTHSLEEVECKTPEEAYGPDLILMDIRLPKMNGFEVTKKLRENPEFSHTPIIALTAHAMAGDRESVIKSGCDTYLSKPVDTRQLPIVIAEMLLKRRGENSSTNGDHNEQK